MAQRPEQFRKNDLAALAVHGSVTRRQLLGYGLTRNEIDYRVQIGRLFRVHAGVYAVGRPLTTPLEHASAAVLACGERAALGGLSALALHGLYGWPRVPIVLVAGSKRNRPGIDTRRCTTLTRADVRTYQRVRATTPERTLLDSAPSFDDRTLRRLTNQALRQHLTSRTKLKDLLARNPGRPGINRLAKLTATAARTKSPLEDDFLTFCADHGLPTPQTLATPFGYEVDAYFEAEQVIVELDSEDWHLDPETFHTDRERDTHHAAHGVFTLRLTKRRLTDAEADRLHGILAARRPRAA